MFRTSIPPTETEQLIKLCMSVRRPNTTLAEQLTDLLPGHSFNQRWANYLLRSSLRSFSTLSEHYTFNGQTIRERLKEDFNILKQDPEGYHKFLLEMRNFFNSEVNMTNPIINNYIIHHFNQDAILALARPIIEFIATKTKGEEQWTERFSTCQISSIHINCIRIHFTSYLKQFVFAKSQFNAVNSLEYQATVSADPYEELTPDPQILRQSHTAFTLIYELTTNGINIICQSPEYTIQGQNSARFNAIFQSYLHNTDIPPRLLSETMPDDGPRALVGLASLARPEAPTDPRFQPAFHHLMK